mmetsp:Transcript_75677/g.210200  ORF Transcript_75677/g.210200 Transcript_75677/m.210200 type:complete len:203 (+) Transcript_75677:94-702(+)
MYKPICTPQTCNLATWANHCAVHDYQGKCQASKTSQLSPKPRAVDEDNAARARDGFAARQRHTRVDGVQGRYAVEPNEEEAHRHIREPVRGRFSPPLRRPLEHERAYDVPSEAAVGRHGAAISRFELCRDDFEKVGAIAGVVQPPQGARSMARHDGHGEYVAQDGDQVDAPKVGGRCNQVQHVSSQASSDGHEPPDKERYQL